MGIFSIMEFSLMAGRFELKEHGLVCTGDSGRKSKKTDTVVFLKFFLFVPLISILITIYGNRDREIP